MTMEKISLQGGFLWLKRFGDMEEKTPLQRKICQSRLEENIPHLRARIEVCWTLLTTPEDDIEKAQCCEQRVMEELRRMGKRGIWPLLGRESGA